MSRIATKPFPLPHAVTPAVPDPTAPFPAPEGELGRAVPPGRPGALEDKAGVVRRPSGENRHKALHGLTRTLIANMGDGVRPWSALCRFSSEGRRTTTALSSRAAVR